MVRKALLAAVAAVTLAAPAVSMAQVWRPLPPPPPYAFHHARWFGPGPWYGWGFYRPRPIVYGPECFRQVRYDPWGVRHVVTRCF
jgi:hypothetical protein